MVASTPWQEIPLPGELATRLQAAYDLPQPPTTLGELAAARVRTPTAVLSAERLLSDAPTRHQVRTGDTTRYTHCAMDALLLPLLTGQPVTVRTRSPLGEHVTLEVTPETVTADAPEAVVSFGLARTDQGDVRQAVCPYLNVFPSRAAYERWAAATPEAVTIPLTLAEAFAFARALAARREPSRRDGDGEGACCRARPRDTTG